MSVYIIGNGPSATRHQLGKIIDSADVVVRLNDFKTAGFERFVGSKTDILFTCRLNEYLDTIDNFPEVILCLLMNPLDGVTIPPAVIDAPNISERIGWDQVNELTPLLNLAENCYPSTGLLCLLKMIARFGHVNVVGFDHFGGGNGHYYDRGPRKDPPRHDGKGEAYWFKFFNQLGMVTYAGELSYYQYDGHAAYLNPDNHEHDGRTGPPGQNRQGLQRPQLHPSL